MFCHRRMKRLHLLGRLLLILRTDARLRRRRRQQRRLECLCAPTRLATVRRCIEHPHYLMHHRHTWRTPHPPLRIRLEAWRTGPQNGKAICTRTMLLIRTACAAGQNTKTMYTQQTPHLRVRIRIRTTILPTLVARRIACRTSTPRQPRVSHVPM